MAMRWSVCVCGVLAVVLRQAVAADVPLHLTPLSPPASQVEDTWTSSTCDGLASQEVVNVRSASDMGNRALTFGGELHVRARFVLNSYTPWGRIFDFGSGAGQDNVLLTLTADGSELMLQVFRNGGAKQVACRAPSLDKWHNVEVTIAHDGNTGVNVVGKIYVDDRPCAEGPLHLPEVVKRTSNLIESSNWEGNPNLAGTVKDFVLSTCPMYPICDNALDVVNDQSMDSNKDHPLTLAPSTFGGAIYVKARVTLNSHTQWGRIIDFGNGAGPDNIIVTLWDTSKQIAVQVHRDGAGEAGVVQCPVVVPLGTSFTVEANILRVGSSDTQGEATIYIDGVWCAKGAVHLPRVVHRSKNYVGHSNWAGNEPLDGTVSSLIVSSCPLPCVDVKPVASFEDPETFNQQAPLTFGGGFYFKATVTFNEHTEWGRIFDFGNGAEMDNVLLGLFADTKQLVLEVWRGDVRQNVVCTTVVPLHTAVTVEASITPISGSTVDGVGAIYINGVRCVEGPVHQPREVLRVSNLVKKSNWAGNSDLEGSVNNFQLSTC